MNTRATMYPAPSQVRQRTTPRRWWAVVVAALASVGLLVLGAAGPAHAVGSDVGTTWTLRKSDAAAGPLRSIAYGNGLYVATVWGSGEAGHVMTSPDGINWTDRQVYETNYAYINAVTFGNGTFVLTRLDGDASFGEAPKHVMTSTDGITWTPRDTPDGHWVAVTYGNGLFVAVSDDNPRDVWSGEYTDQQVMTSSDGINWTARNTPPGGDSTAAWQGVGYGNGTFVAVAGQYSAAGTARVMYSSNGATWTTATVPNNDFNWRSVTYGNGTFVAVAAGGAGNRVLTSTNGVNWTARASASDASRWVAVTYGNGLFVATTANDRGLGDEQNRAMTSPDGVTWTTRSVAADTKWWALTYGGEKFVAVGDGSPFGGGLDKVMTSNEKFINQVKDPVNNTTPTDLMQLVPPSGTTTIDAIDITYNTQARINAVPGPPTPGTRWGIWAWKWADKTLTLDNSNVIPINLATYQNAGSCTAIGMPAKDCPRPTPMGPVKPGQSQVFQANFQIGGKWIGQTPRVTITRPAAK